MSTVKTAAGLVFGIVLAAAPVLAQNQGSAVADLRLVQAARKGEAATVRTLLTQRVDVNVAAADGSTALLWAAYRSDMATARALIAAGAKVDAANRLGVTPLLQASRLGDAALVELLLDAGANPARIHQEGETVLMAAAASGNLKAVTLLLAGGVDVNAREQAQNQTALMWAADEGHLPIVKALLAAGADVNSVAKPNPLENHRGDGGRMWSNHSSGGLTALMFGARQGHAEVIAQLAGSGAGLNHANPDGLTALMLAVLNDRLDAAGVLIDKGANVNDGTLYEAVHLHNLRSNETVGEATRPRPQHVNTLTPIDVIAMMLDRGADPSRPATHTLNVDGTGIPDAVNESALVRALRSQDIAVLKLLVAKGADVNAATRTGQTPLMVVAAGGRAPFSGGFGVAPGPFRFPGQRSAAAAVTLLLAAGADVHAATSAGDTALHAAAQDGNVDLIQQLVDEGARFDATNKAGLTPLDAAMGKQAPGAGASRGGPGPGRGGGPQPQAVALLRTLMGLPREAAR